MNERDKDRESDRVREKERETKRATVTTQSPGLLLSKLRTSSVDTLELSLAFQFALSNVSLCGLAF